ncbi:MAG: 1-acyl-sn-glycerol-3-phosphate acyltransferase [Candidatus Hydrogenedentota bacterium]
MADKAKPFHHYTKKRTHYSAFSRWLGRAMLRLLGWKLVGTKPDVPSCVVACAPHRSNWDFFYTLLASWALDIPCVFMMKESLLKGPLRPLLLWLGAIPINRLAPEGIVDQMAHIMRESGRMNVVITPEGTRKDVTHWKLGFWRIAVAAEAPILFGVINYDERWVGVADTYYPTGDLDKDWAHITAVFQRTLGITPVYRKRNTSEETPAPPSDGEA